MSAQRWHFSGQTFEQVRHLGQGGQGTVHEVRALDGTPHSAIIKQLLDTPENHQRLTWLIESGVGFQVPGITAPLAMAETENGVISYLAAYSAGVSLEEDQPRPFPELLEIAVVLSSLWQRLEEKDIAPSNVLITPSGVVDLIDLDNYAIHDNTLLPPSMYGQHPMLAPELRQARNDELERSLNIHSDRFAWGVLLSFLLLGRHPADGQAKTPQQFDQLMMKGTWPERSRKNEADETPITALGEQLLTLFDLAFSTDLQERPSARQWHQTLVTALQQLHIHPCGGTMIWDTQQTHCPWCQDVLIVEGRRLQFTHAESGVSSHYTLQEGTFPYLGRDNLPNASGYVSQRHLRCYLQDDILYLDHLGSHDTVICFAGESAWYKLEQHRESMNSPRLDGLRIVAADGEWVVEVG